MFIVLRINRLQFKENLGTRCFRSNSVFILCLIVVSSGIGEYFDVVFFGLRDLSVGGPMGERRFETNGSQNR